MLLAPRSPRALGALDVRAGSLLRHGLTRLGLGRRRQQRGDQHPEWTEQERGNHAPAPGPREVLSLAVDATAQQAALTASLHAALADGRLTDDEHTDLVRQLDQAEATTHRVRLALRGRVAS